MKSPLSDPSQRANSARSEDVGGGRPLAVFFGTYDASVHPRVRVLVEGLAGNGYSVVEVNEPLGFDTASRVQLARQPWRAPFFIMRVAKAWWRLRVDAKALLNDLADHPIDMVVVGYMGQFDVHLAQRLFDAPVAIDFMVGLGDTAKDRGSHDLIARVLTWIDRRATAAADVIVVDTGEQAAQCPSPSEPVVVPVGAPEIWYRTTRHEPTVPPEAPDPGTAESSLSVVFYGLYTPLQGTPFIGDAINALADRHDITFTLVGTGQDRGECERRAGAAASRVRWIDWLEPEDLVAEVKRHDVCLGIFGTTPKASKVVPNKVFQGAAAGCAIVTSETAPQREVLGEAGFFCRPGDGVALADQLRALADSPDALKAMRSSARTLADNYRPTEVVIPLLAKLEGYPS